MFHTSDNPHISLTINGVAIAQDSAGRYRITDLHKASGGERRHEPFLWLRLQQTRDLIQALIHYTDLSNDDAAPFEPVKTINGGNHPGTYADKDLLIDYAMWISADFKLRVIQAFREQQLKLGSSSESRLSHSLQSLFCENLSEENRLLKEQIALLQTVIDLKNHYLVRCGKAVEADINAHPVSSTPPPPPPSTDVPHAIPTDAFTPADPPWLAILKHWSQAVSRGEFTTFHRDRIEDQPVVLVRLNHILQYLGEQRDTAQGLLKYSIPAFKRELRAHGILLSDQPHERNIDGRRVSNLRALNLHVLKQWKAWDVE